MYTFWSAPLKKMKTRLGTFLWAAALFCPAQAHVTLSQETYTKAFYKLDTILRNGSTSALDDREFVQLLCAKYAVGFAAVNLELPPDTQKNELTLVSKATQYAGQVLSCIESLGAQSSGSLELQMLYSSPDPLEKNGCGHLTSELHSLGLLRDRTAKYLQGEEANLTSKGIDDYAGDYLRSYLNLSHLKAPIWDFLDQKPHPFLFLPIGEERPYLFLQWPISLWKNAVRELVEWL